MVGRVVFFFKVIFLTCVTIIQHNTLIHVVLFFSFLLGLLFLQAQGEVILLKINKLNAPHLLSVIYKLTFRALPSKALI